MRARVPVCGQAYAQLVISTYTRLQGIDVTNATWWREARESAIDKWGALENVPWMIGLRMNGQSEYGNLGLTQCDRTRRSMRALF